ncbi:MAG: proteasome assembly chaperone family protein [DPANN group archaeon]|nr:proteasome assembly chaperone family protein [DPANN group archaeon]
MKTTEITILKKPELNNPIFIEGLPGVGYIGRNVAGYLIDTLEAEKFAELYSFHFPPVAMLDSDKNGKMSALKNEFYFYKAKNKNEKDIIILIGDAQSMDPIGHYEITKEIIDFIKEYKPEMVITIGGFATGKLDNKTKTVFGAAVKDEIIATFEKKGIKFKDTNIGQIIGASGLLVLEAEKNKIDAICLMGETSGMLLSDPKATESVLEFITKYLNLKIDMSKIEEKVKETGDVIKKIESLQKKMTLQNMPKQSTNDEHLGYIG